MSCPQCQGIKEMFSQEHVAKELASYRDSGPDDTTLFLIDAIKKKGVGGCSLLDIGGGLGAIQTALIEAGIEHATDVDASPAYLSAAKDEASRHGYTERVSYIPGNFVDLAGQVAPADIVTLDRVICCYPEMEKLVSLSVARAQKLYGLVFPRDTWWSRLGTGLANIYFRLRGSPFRIFAHPTRAVEAIVSSYGFKRCFYQRTMLWQVVLYNR